MNVTARLLILSIATLLPACGPYRLEGRVVTGPASMIEVVESDDPRLNEAPLGGASIQLMLDPESLGRKPIGSGVSRKDGSFSIPIEEFGAGFLEYDVEVVAQLKSHITAIEQMRLPGGSKRLLITLARGRDTYRPMNDPFKDTEFFLPKKNPGE